MTDSKAIDFMLAEMSDAKEQYGPYTSTHEAYGVLAEEVYELLEAIRSNRRDMILQEAVQVAGVALRLAQQCHDEIEPAFMQRSGLRR